jgi:hypothetical protein
MFREGSRYYVALADDKGFEGLCEKFDPETGLVVFRDGGNNVVIVSVHSGFLKAIQR